MADKVLLLVEAERDLYTDEEWRELKRDSDALRERLNSEFKRGYDKGYRDAQYFFHSYSPDEAEAENDENWVD